MKWLKQSSRENEQDYRMVKKIAKKTCRQKKRKFLESQLKEIESNYTKRQTREFYQGIRNQKQGYQNKAAFIKDEKGNLVGGIEEKLECWDRYFEKVLNGEETEYHEEENSSEEERGDAYNYNLQ